MELVDVPDLVAFHRIRAAPMDGSAIGSRGAGILGQVSRKEEE